MAPLPSPTNAAAISATTREWDRARPANPAAPSPEAAARVLLKAHRSTIERAQKLDINHPAVITTRSKPSPASGAPKDCRIDGHVVPSAPVGRPSPTNVPTETAMVARS